MIDCPEPKRKTARFVAIDVLPVIVKELLFATNSSKEVGVNETIAAPDNVVVRDFIVTLLLIVTVTVFPTKKLVLLKLITTSLHAPGTPAGLQLRKLLKLASVPDPPAVPSPIHVLVPLPTVIVVALAAELHPLASVTITV